MAYFHQKTLYKDTYRVETTRASWLDYNCGVYYITICTADAAHAFGEIPDDEAVIHLTPLGKVAERLLKDIEKKRKGAKVLVSQVMPNHVHFVLDTTQCEYPECPSCNTTVLSYLVNVYKGAVTRWAKLHGIPFAWQTRYYDEVITQKDTRYREVFAYITHNVESWQLDENNYSARKDRQPQ